MYRQICEGFGFSASFCLPSSDIGSTRFHLIPAWGYGFWSDVHHVVIQATLADLMGRSPIVYWGANSLYKHPTQQANYFEQFFEPIGSELLSNLDTADSFYPPVWNRHSHLTGTVAKWSGPYSRLAAPWFFTRTETVTAAEFYTPLSDIIPWIDASHPYAKLGEDALYRQAFSRYAKPRDDYRRASSDFHTRHMQGARWVAVHVRGTDKILETPNLPAMLQLTHQRLATLLAADPALRIFLLTDSVQLLRHFNEHYPGRLLATNATRRDDTRGVHTVGDDGAKLGSEILLESLVALKCDYFVGSMETNVALAISSMKDWAPDQIFLLGTQPVRGPNPFLYK